MAVHLQASGIQFSSLGGSLAGSTSALLSDYEEGTFTLTFTANSASITPTCYYVKVGKLVHIAIRAVHSVGTGGPYNIVCSTNMPFTPLTNTRIALPASFLRLITNVTQNPVMLSNHDSAAAHPVYETAGTGNSSISDWTKMQKSNDSRTDAYYNFNGTYRIT